MKPIDIHELVHDRDLMKNVSGDDIAKAVFMAYYLLSYLSRRLVDSKSRSVCKESDHELPSESGR